MFVSAACDLMIAFLTVLVGVISFTVAVVITALCIKLRERERHRKDTERENTPH